MLVDMHTHTKGVSSCSRITFEEVIDLSLEKGIDGVIITNHYQKSYIAKHDSIDSYIDRFIEEFYQAKEYGQKVGCKVFFGIEVTMELYPFVHMLIYGVDPEFLRKNPYLFDCTQEELYRIVKAHNGLLVQGHPYRCGTTILDTDFLDGVEVNCHPVGNRTDKESLIEIAKEKGLFVTCGGDYHADVPNRPKCGMYMPDNLSDHNDLREFLLSPEANKLCVKEQQCEDAVDVFTK